MPLKTTIRTTFCSLVVLVQIASFPSFALAQEVVTESPTPTATDSAPTSGSPEPEAQQAPAPVESSSTPPSAPDIQTPQGATNTGPQSPTGADSSTYTQNPDGTWSNDLYTWDPVTKQTRPNTPQEYSYNPATGMWDTVDYIYSPETGTYVPNVRSLAANNPLIAALVQLSGGSNPLVAGGPNTFTIGNTGPNSNNGINLGSDTMGTFDLFFNGAISNNVSSNAQSGNALVQGNTLGGDALSGDANALANLLNMLQSSWLGSSNMATFATTIDGNVVGDLLIDPDQLPYAIGSNNSDIDVNASNNGAIDNNIDLAAKSGDATVDGNTEAGDATSGDARAMANVINMLNSAIHSGKSFIGTINITGNLDGDILLPQGVLDALISTTGPNSTNTIGGTTNSDTTLNSTANRTINNNINTDSTSGNAGVTNNTQAGNATTGTAKTSVDTMNIVGQKVTGKKGLLVFVNVLGHWYGMVVGPATTTAQITGTGPGSTNSIGPGNSNQSLTVNSDENSLINNDINISTQSGDATVSNNTTGGNATSGDTESAVNLLNIIGSDIDMSDWFGVLFINVFGNWFGDFGNDTAHGGFSQSPPAAAPSTTATTTGGAATSSTPAQVFSFFARGNNANGQLATNTEQTTNGNTNANTAVFGNTTPGDPTTGTSSSSTAVTAPQLNWWVIAGIIGVLTTVIVVAREYILAIHEEQEQLVL